MGSLLIAMLPGVSSCDKLEDGAPAQSIDNLTDDIAYMIAYLTVALIETPKWWNQVLEEGLENYPEENYAMYGLPLFKATAVKYG